MKAPENLVKAVERLEPRLILLLDANTIMDYPQFVSHEIAAPGRFLLVVPQAVDNEILGLTFNPAQGTKQKASRARKQLGRLYEQGNPVVGIDLGNDRWIMTVRTPRPAASEPIEDDQIWRYLGQVDAALLRLADACAEDISNTRTVLVTKDKDLTHAARSRGHAVCLWPKLRSPETVEKLLLHDDRSGPAQDIDTYLSSLLDSNDEQPLKIAMTLEELRSEGDYLIASGIGSLTYDKTTHPFRWTFPYINVGKAEDFESMWEIAQDAGSMPVENVDFMGADEKIPERVRRLVCSLLEGSAAWGQERLQRTLQSSRTQVRLSLGFIMGNDWGTFTKHLPMQAKEHAELLSKSSEELGDYDRVWASHEQCIQSLLDGTAKDIGDTYISAFKCREQMESLLGLDPMDDDRVTAKLEVGLSMMIQDALDTWAVGETVEEELLYRPFEWAEEIENTEDLESEDDEHYEEFEEEEEEFFEPED